MGNRKDFVKRIVKEMVDYFLYHECMMWLLRILCIESNDYVPRLG